MSTIAKTKSTLRKTLRRTRRALSKEKQEFAATCINKRLQSLPNFMRAKNVATYAAFDGEVNIDAVSDDLTKNWYLPLISDSLRPWEKKRLIFQAHLKSDPLSDNRYAIKEPIATPKYELKPWCLDIVLVPLVGFDRSGNRLGMGQGYYDRTFSTAVTRFKRPRFIGIGHSFQECNKLKREPWDIQLDCIITEKEIITCTSAYKPKA